MSGHPRPMTALTYVRRSAWVGGGLLLLLHAVTFVVLFAPTLFKLKGEVRTEVSAISSHLVAFQVALAACVFVIGAAAGALAAVAVYRPSRRGVMTPVVIAGALVSVAMARSVAHRPALFEDLLWRRGGLWAGFQVLLVEKLGSRVWDSAFAGLVLALVGLTVWRLHHSLWASRKLTLAAVAVLAGAVFGAQRWRHGPVRMHGTPIIVLAADSLRLDHLSSQGYPRPTSPNIDALVNAGAQTAEMFVPIASTTPSWASLLSGLYPHRHGVRDLFPRAEATHLHLRTLPQILHDAGYLTSVVSDYAGETFQRVDFGFDHVDAPPATSVEVFADREALQSLPIPLALLTGPWGQRLFPVTRYLPVNADAAMLTERIEAELTRLEQQEKPFFLVAFYSVTHAPFAPPMPDAAAFTRRDYSGKSRYGYELQQLSDLARVGDRPSDAEIEQVRGLYDGSVRAFDREVGVLTARLDRDGLRERLVVITGDHGENLFEPGTTTEHGKWFRGGSLANRTPFIISGLHSPVKLAARASGVDFMPTLLDAVGVPAPPQLDGHSALRTAAVEPTDFAETALWLGGTASAPAGALAYPPLTEILEVEAGTHALVLKRRYLETTITAKLRTARRWPWQLVYVPVMDGVRYELYNLAEDPMMLHDRQVERPEVAAKLQGELKTWLELDPLRWLDAADHVVRRVEQ